MRNLKKYLAVIVTVCILATFTVPAFAAKTEAEICTDLGVLKGSGSGVTADYLKTEPDRLQGAIMFLRLKGLEDTAKAWTGTDNFADVNELNGTNKAIAGYLKANPSLGFAGVGDNKFAPLEKMTAKQYYKIMLVALGYEYDKDFTWSNLLTFAASNGLVKNIDIEKFTANDLCAATVEALKTTIKGGTGSLIASLVDRGNVASDKAIASGLYVAAAKTLEIVSATADNLKTVKFVFNKELDSNTVIASNFTVPAAASVKLLDDKRTVVVILTDAVEQSKSMDITVKNIKSTDGMAIAETKKTLTFVDNTVPVISGIVAKNTKTLVITASEPIKAVYNDFHSFADIKIDGLEANTYSTVFDYTKNILTLNIVFALSGGTHKIEVGGLKDYAGFTAVARTFSIGAAADTAAAEITSAKVNNTREIEVTFNEDLDVLGVFKVNGEDVNNSAFVQDSKSSVILTLNTALNIAAIVEIAVKYKDQIDFSGNKTAEKTFLFKTADDTTLPTVTASIDAANKITLTFSKNMVKAGIMKVFKSDGNQLGNSIDLSSASVTWDSSSVCKIAANTGSTGLDNTEAKDIRIKLSDMKDATVRANVLVETSIDLKAGDTRMPGVTAYYSYDAKTSDAADDEFTIFFSEAMNEDSIRNLSNYYINSGSGKIYNVRKPLSTYSDVSISYVASDKQSITIKGRGFAADLPEIQVSAVKDATGNTLTTPVVVAAKPANLLPMVDAAVVQKVVSGTKIEITFTQDIRSCQYGAFILTDSNGTVTAAVVSSSYDGKKVTMTLDRDIGTTAAKAYLKVLNKDYVKDFYGSSMTTGGAFAGADKFQLTDAVAPTVSFTPTSAGISINFSEELAAMNAATINSFLTSELMLTKGADPVTVSATQAAIGLVGGKTQINILGLAPSADYKIKLFPKGYVKDLFGNNFAITDEIAVTTK
jgi:hypothetical protein